MKRSIINMLAVAVLGLAGQSGLSAQLTGFVGGGPTFPTSDYGEYAKTGYLGFGGIQYALPSGLALSANGYYGSNGHEGSGDKTNLYGAMAGVGYAFPTGGSLMPSVFGLLGTMTHAYKPETGSGDSETKLAFGGGAQLGFPLGGINAFVNGWYVTASFDSSTGPSESTAIIGASVGVAFPLGS